MCPALVVLLIAAGMVQMLVGWLLFDALKPQAAAAPPQPIDPPPPLDAPETAAQRGERLLLRLLSPAQRTEYQNAGKITVPITVTGSKYAFAQIAKTQRGVTWMPPQEATLRGITEQCVYVIPHCPITGVKLVKEDDLIAKLIWLRTDPVGLAHVSGLQIRTRPFPDWFRCNAT